MTTATWTDEFEELLREHLPLLGPDAPLEPDLVVGDYGLDSMAAVALLLEVERRYEVAVPDEDLSQVLGSDVQQLWQMVLRRTSP